MCRIGDGPPIPTGQRGINNHMKISSRTSAFAVVLFLASAALAQQMPPTLVVTDSVREMEFHDQITLTGRTEAVVSSNIVAEVSGRVAKIDAGEGVPVKAGQSLVSIDSEQIQYSLDSKTAETEQARQRADLAADLLRRTKDLHDRSLVAQTALDSATAWATITEQQFRQLDADRQKLALDLANCRIKAPFSGYTGRKLVDVGGWVSPGTPVFEMSDISHIRVRVDLPERYFGHLEIGSRVSVVQADISEKPMPGKVIGISPSANGETHTFPVLVDVPNREGRLAGGMLVRASLSMREKFNSLAVSKDAIIRQGMQTLVYTVIDGKAAPVPVLTTSTEGDMIAVKGEQLAAGMPVVVRGNERIFPGSPVNVAGGDPGEQAAVDKTPPPNQ